MVGELVSERPGHLRLQLVGVAPKVADERVLEDDDPIMEVVLRDRVALVEAVGAAATAPVRDHNGDVLERSMELERKVIDRRADERLEVLVVGRVEQL